MPAPYRTKLEEVSTYSYHAAPDDLARLGFAVAHELDERSPGVTGLPENLHSLAVSIAQALRDAKHPLVVSGASCGSEALIEAAANIAGALYREGRPADLCVVVPECNSLGVALMGKGSVNDAFKEMHDGTADTVIILENDLYRRAERCQAEIFLKKARNVIAIDHTMTETTAMADIVLPAAAFAEADGTLVNNEGRAQRFFRVFVPDRGIQESWQWLRDILTAAGRPGVKEWVRRMKLPEHWPAPCLFLKLLQTVLQRQGFELPERKFPASRTAIADGPQCTPMFQYMSQNRLMMRILPCHFLWKDMKDSRLQRLLPDSGHLAGIRSSL